LPSGPTARTAVCLLAASILSGCGPTANLIVSQPEAPGAAGRMRLASRWAFFDTGETDRYLAGFPFPGAVAGDRQYVLYLVCEPGLGEKRIGDSGDRVWPRAAGFFIQERGRHAGLTRMTAGTVRVKRVPFAGRKRRKIEVAIQCDDGTVLSGQMRAVESLLELRDFQEGPHAADVAALAADHRHGPPAHAGIR